MAAHGMCNGLQDVAALLSRGRKVAAYAGELLRALKRTETARDFEAKLDHADVLFRQIIGERNLVVMKKREHGVFMLAKPGKEIVGRGLFGSAACLVLGRCRQGVGLPSEGQNLSVLFRTVIGIYFVRCFISLQQL